MNNSRFFLLSLALLFAFVTTGHSFDSFIPYHYQYRIIIVSNLDTKYSGSQYYVAQSNHYSQDSYDEVFKYCSRDFYLRILYETSCCAQRLTDGRKSGKHFSSIVFKATPETFAGCVSSEKVYQNGYRRARSLLTPYLKDRFGTPYSLEELESTSICTGKTLVNTFTENPIPRKNLYNKMFRSSFVTCKSDRGTAYRDQITYPLEDKYKIKENNDR